MFRILMLIFLIAGLCNSAEAGSLVLIENKNNNAVGKVRVRARVRRCFAITLENFKPRLSGLASQPVFVKSQSKPGSAILTISPF